MKVKFIITALVTSALCLTSCKSREEKVINKLDNLSERIERNGSKFDAEDWEEAIEDFADIHEEMQDCEFTKEQLRELGKKEGKVSAIIAKEGSKALGREFKNFLGNFGAFAKGFKEGAEENVNEDDFNKVENDISNALQEFENQLKD